MQLVTSFPEHCLNMKALYTIFLASNSHNHSKGRSTVSVNLKCLISAINLFSQEVYYALRFLLVRTRLTC